jgi:hypothetical protein
MNRQVYWYQRALLGLLVLLSACGGGGSTDSASGVTVSAATPAVITAKTFVDQAMQNVTLTGNVTGNVESLQGKTIYIVVEDPASLFMPTATLSLTRTATGFSYSLPLVGKTLTTAGKLLGKVRVFACLDSQCKQPLGGTPVVVDYDVTVESGLSLSRSEIIVSVPFGTTPAPESIDLTWSSLSPGWAANVTTAYVANVPSTVTTVSPGTGKLNTSSKLQLQLGLAPAGTYTETIQVVSTATLPDRREFRFEKTLTVRYTVTPSAALDYVFSPARFDLTQSASDTLFRESFYKIITNTGVTAAYAGIEFLSGTSAQGPVTSWFQNFPNVGTATCTGTILTGGALTFSCLSPGVYTAQVRYNIIAPSGSRSVVFPISLTVTP